MCEMPQPGAQFARCNGWRSGTEASMDIHEAMVLAVLALATAVEMKVATPSWPVQSAFNWSVEDLAVEPICTDVELSVGCVLAMAN
jgi:hypothetical protein